MNHTPAPWRFYWRSLNKEAVCGVFAEPREGHAYAIAQCPQYEKQEQWEANARLICAAPAMLAALKEAIAFIGNEPEGLELAYRIAALIKQAEGEQ